MECVKLVFVIEMAHKTKTMLTRAQHEKIMKENAQRPHALKDKTTVRTEMNGEADKKKGKDVVPREGKIGKQNMEKGLKTGMKVLKEIRKYQTSTDLLI